MDTRTRWVVGALSAGTLLSPLNSSMIAVALVPLRHDFGLNAAEVSWVVTVFYLASAAGQPAMGRLGDRFGARRLFVTGMVAAAAVSAATMVAPSFALVCTGRAVLAIGTATAFPSAVTMIRPLSESSGVPASHLLGRIQIANTSGAAIGPVLGGVLETLYGWPAIIAVTIPVALLSALGVAGWAPRDGATHRAAAGRDPRSIITNRPLLVVYLSFAVFNIVFYIAFFGIPQALQERGQYSSGTTGLLMLPLAAVTVVLTAAVARAIDRLGQRRVLRTGAVALIGGVTLLLTGARSLHPVAVLLMTAGLGVPYCIVNLALTQALYASARPGEAGVASGIFQASRYLGAIVASVVLGVVLAHGDTAGTWSIAAMIAIGLAVVHAAIAWRWQPTVR